MPAVCPEVANNDGKRSLLAMYPVEINLRKKRSALQAFHSQGDELMKTVSDTCLRPELSLEGAHEAWLSQGGVFRLSV